MREQDLAALLIFGPESQYYLTGYDTNGYVFFQCLVLTVEEVNPLTLLTRRPDLEQARRTSIIEDIRLWYDREGKDPTEELHEILREKGLAGHRVGVERDTFGLNAKSYDLIRERLGTWCALADGSTVIRPLRLVKSPAEQVYVRKAAELADNALEAMLEKSRPGAFEGEIAAAGSTAIFDGGGDPPASGPVLGSGDRALLLRGSTGAQHLGATDQLTMEFAATYRRYNVCLMRTAAIGKEPQGHRRMFEVTLEALQAMTEAARPGKALGDIDDAHRDIFDKRGFEKSRMAACGYSLGATYRPSWMDVPPMLYSGNPQPVVAGMTLFLHSILVDANAGLAMSIGYTILTTNGSPEVLSRYPLDYLLCK
jgi:Xaa-Pro dipeptidase